MMPTLITIGAFSLSSFLMFLILAFLVFSFLFWRHLRDQGIEEDRIFDMMTYGSIVALIAGRIGFALLRPDVFIGMWIRVFTIWIQPGLWFFGALLGAFLVFIIIAFRYRINRFFIIDATAKGLGISYIIGAIGTFFGGMVVGIPTHGPLGVRFVGYSEMRHPIGLYEAGSVIFILLFLAFIQRLFPIKMKRPGMYGLWFFLLFSIFFFTVEFFKESHVYWGSLRVNQWIAVALFSQTVGALLVWGGGKEWLGWLFGRIRIGIGFLKRRIGVWGSRMIFFLKSRVIWKKNKTDLQDK